MSVRDAEKTRLPVHILPYFLHILAMQSLQINGIDRVKRSFHLVVKYK